MMDEEKFNTELKSRIAEVFDNYDDTRADEGWALLRQKYPAKEKHRGLAWLWYAAAAIALLVMGVWFMQKPDANNGNNLAVKPNKTIQQPEKKVEGPYDSAVTNNNQTPVLVKVDTSARHTTVQPNSTVPQTANVPAPKNNVVKTQWPMQDQQVPAPGSPSAGNYALNQAKKDRTLNPAGNIVKTDSPIVNKNNAALAAVNKPVSNAAQQAVESATTNKTNTQVIAAQTQPIKTNTEKAIMDLLNQTQPKIAKADKNKTDKKASLSLYAATYFNYATGSDNQLNVGAGFTSDFKISSKLKLSTGVSIGQNSLNFNNSGSGGRLQLSAAADNASPATLSGAIGNSAGSTFNASNNAKTTPEAKKYKASLIGLDIPINFKYQFSPKSDTYVLAGVSSGTYITETYKTTSTTSLVTQESTVQSNFSTFDLAKTLNFSFGVGYPLGKSNQLIVEPFLKYPLDGLGAQQIKFGAGGINLKLNFQAPKK